MATTIPRTMVRKGFNIRWRYVIAVAILVPVVAHLFFAITRSPFMNYYVTVDELATSAPTSKARVGGAIAPGTINWDNALRTLTFQLQGEARNLAVTYRGFAPDTFRDDATVIVEGELNRDGTFMAYNLLIKCPHQYVPAL